MDFKGKVVVITGGGSGIGKATCLAFQRQKASVVVVDKDISGGEATISEIQHAGGSALFIQADTAIECDVAMVSARTVQEYGGIDVLINNAGVGHDGTVVNDTSADWDRILAANLRSVYLCCHVMIPEIYKRGSGAIVNVGSAQSCAASPCSAAYVASKFGVLGLTKAMAVDHAPEIRVNAVLPGSVDTPLFRGGGARFQNYDELLRVAKEKIPMKRVGQPQELAEVIVFLAGPKASFITGAAISVDGGMLARI